MFLEQIWAHKTIAAPKVIPWRGFLPWESNANSDVCAGVCDSHASTLAAAIANHMAPAGQLGVMRCTESVVLAKAYRKRMSAKMMGVVSVVGGKRLPSWMQRTKPVDPGWPSMDPSMWSS